MEDSDFFLDQTIPQAFWPNSANTHATQDGSSTDPHNSAVTTENRMPGISDSLTGDPVWLSTPVSATSSDYVKLEDISSASPIKQEYTNGTATKDHYIELETRKVDSDPSSPAKRSKILAKNRQAANRYRLRQKDYVQNLERRCHREIEKRREQSALVKSLQEEVSSLEYELLRQSSCGCSYIRESLYSLIHTTEDTTDP